MATLYLSLLSLLLIFAEFTEAEEVMTDYEMTVFEGEVNGTELVCPTWFVPALNKSRQPRCECGSEFGGYLRCANAEKSVSVLGCYCVTRNKTGSLFMASCLFTCGLVNGSEYLPIPADPSKLEDKICAPYHRRGPLCSKCAEGYAVSSFSIFLTCVKCPTSRWLEYFALTLLPLTVFYFVILFFRFRATSAWLDAYILYSQIITSPGTTRLLLYQATNVATNPTDILSQPISYLLRTVQSLYSVWNLNFFQLLVPPFCLDPSFSALEVIALDYLTAFYPLFLVLISYVILVLHARNFKPLVVIWKPFSKINTRFRNKIAVSTHSVIDSFATFILLSYVKLIYVSSDLMHFTIPRFPSGETGRPVWNYDGSVEYFGSKHVGYGVLAIFVYALGILLPLMFLALYPCKYFRRKCPRLYNKPQIHAFMDCFQGHYKNGTDGTRDYRYFASFYLSMRVIGLIITEYVVLGYAVPIGGMLIAGFGGMILVFKPYRKDIHNICNGVILLIMAMWLMSLSLYQFPLNNVALYNTIAAVLDYFFCTLPLFYFMFLIVRYIRFKIKRTMCVDKVKYCLRDLWHRKKRPRELSTIEERAYSFPDRVVNPRDYETRLSTNSKTAMLEESVVSRDEAAVDEVLAQVSLEENVESSVDGRILTSPYSLTSQL